MLLTAFGIAACSGLSKGQALEMIQAGVKEDGSCTLPIEIISKLKVQHVTRGVCVPKDPSADKARACMQALVAANVTKPMSATYMADWPDDIAAMGFDVLPASSRQPRSLVFSSCVELTGNLRVGLFPCAAARAEKIIKVTSVDDKHADVRYEREIGLRPTVPAIDAACGTVTRPPGEALARFEKDASGWKLLPPENAPP